MKRVVPLALSLAFASAPASADTLREALAKAYRDNPTITGSRARQRATDETVPIARAAGRPNLSSNAGVVDNYLRSGNSFTTPERVAQAQLSLNVPFYSGGAVKNSVRAAQTRVEAGQLALFDRAGEQLHLHANHDAVVLLLSGEPIDEPIVGHGPFVMNSEQEIHQAFNDFHSGRFGAMDE